jgi:zinc protease
LNTDKSNDLKLVFERSGRQTERCAGGTGHKERSKKLLVILTLAALLFPVPRVFAAGTPDKGDQNALRATLDNGLKVVIVRNSLAPVVTTVVNYLAGSNDAPEGFPGTAHAQEHMMFRGNPGLSAGQLADIAAAMGGDFNADTQETVTQYEFTVPAEDLELALHIESIRMRGVLDTEDLWNEERGAIEQEVAQDLSNPDYIFYTKIMGAMFKGTPYSHDALGTKPSFDKTTGEMLKRFYDTWYAPNNAILVIVGDVEPETALAKVRKEFGDVPQKKIPERPAIKLEPVKPGKIALKTDHPFGIVSVVTRMPGYDSPDYAPVKVLSDVLSSKRGSLYSLVPEGKALDTDFGLVTHPGSGLGYVIALFPKGGDSAALIGEVKKIISEDMRKGFSSDLVEAAKRRELTDLELEKNSVSELAMDWSQALAVEGRQSPEEDVMAIQRVTVEDVNRVAKKYLDLDHAIEAILTPEASGQPVSSQSFGGRESLTAQNPTPVKLPEWAESALKRLGVPKSMIHPALFTLSNGLSLIVLPESISDTVSVYGHILNKAEMETPKGQDGVDQVLDKLFPWGSTSLDRVAFQKALDDIGGYEEAGTNFSLQVLTPYFERGLQLLTENELRPALPDAAFTTVRKQAAATLAGKLQSPDYLQQRALKKALFPKNDPTLREATPATVSSLTLDDVKDYYKLAFRPDLTAIIVIGRVTPEKAREEIEKYFGKWKSEGPKPDTFLPPVPLNAPSVTAVPNTSRIQDKVTLAETLSLNRSNPEYYALELGNHVLGGGFYATRLYQDLRQKSGLVYNVSSNFDAGRTRMLYVVRYACDPANVSKARAIVEDNLKKMQTTPVSPGELDQAKALLLREIPLSQSSVDSIAHGFITRVILDLPLNEPTLAAEEYIKLNAAEVRDAFVKWIRLTGIVQVTEGPSPH